MGRSLFGMLHRRFGTRLSGAERTRRIREHQERLRSAVPLGVLRAKPSTGSSPGTVAIIGAGFAGCAAAYTAKQLGFTVTIYDAIGTPGGRVTSSRKVVPGRILETGGELIGLNHGAWLVLANEFGFALGVVTPDDDYSGMGLTSPLILNGTSYTYDEQGRLYDTMQSIFNEWITESAVVTMPFAPWLATNAIVLDAQNLGEKIPLGAPADVVKAIETEFELNNTLPISAQSWLANLAQFQAGGGQGYFDDTEALRSTAGNQQLAIRLVRDLSLVKQTVSEINTSSKGVMLSFQSGAPQAGPFDSVIVATSVAIWKSIQVDGQPFPYPPISSGPAIKYLAPATQRYWIPDSLAPSGMSNTLGMTWEGTDNQADTAGFDLTVFSAGTAAQNAIDNGGSDSYFAPLLSQLYPRFSTSGGTFVNSSGAEHILTGYSCPGPKEVVGAQQSYITPYKDRLWVAGEHTSPGWFGFMEGALESGLIAAVRMAMTLEVDLRPEWGGTQAL